jgi:hypothetical protein
MLLGISETLRQYLVDAIPGTTVKVGAISDLAGRAATKSLMLILYEVEDAGELRTAPARMAPDAQDRVPLRLHYLITAHGVSVDEAQQRLSQTLEAFHEHPVFAGQELHSTLANRVERLTVQLRSTSLDDLHHLWTAFGIGMKLALYYEVNAQPPP